MGVLSITPTVEWVLLKTSIKFDFNQFEEVIIIVILIWIDSNNDEFIINFKHHL